LSTRQRPAEAVRTDAPSVHRRELCSHPPCAKSRVRSSIRRQTGARPAPRRPSAVVEASRSADSGGVSSWSSIGSPSRGWFPASAREIPSARTLRQDVGSTDSRWRTPMRSGPQGHRALPEAAPERTRTSRRHRAGDPGRRCRRQAQQDVASGAAKGPVGAELLRSGGRVPLEGGGMTGRGTTGTTRGF
jgi:hypothetical protein